MGIGPTRWLEGGDWRQPAENNPDPKNFKIEKLAEMGDWVYTEVRYPDCTNFEGLKILVFHKVPAQDIIAAKEIDPHFCDNTHIKPIARFEPTEFGKMLAWHMVKNQGKSQD